MKLLVVSYVLIAILAFIIICVLIEISASDLDRAIAASLHKSLIDYKKAMLISILWIFTLAYLILLSIIELISRIIIKCRNKEDK